MFGVDSGEEYSTLVTGDSVTFVLVVSFVEDFSCLSFDLFNASFTFLSAASASFKDSWVGLITLPPLTGLTFFFSTPLDSVIFVLVVSLT